MRRTSGTSSNALPFSGFVASAKDIDPSRRTSSTERPAVVLVLNPFSSPRSPPSAIKADSDFGFNNLFSWPGEKAKGLFDTSKSSSFPLSGRSASSPDSSNMEVPTTVCAELDLVLNVGSTDWNEPDLDRKVSPPKDEAVGDEGDCTASMVPSLTAEGGDRVWPRDMGDGDS